MAFLAQIDPEILTKKVIVFFSSIFQDQRVEGGKLSLCDLFKRALDAWEEWREFLRHAKITLR